MGILNEKMCKTQTLHAFILLFSLLLFDLSHTF